MWGFAGGNCWLKKPGGADGQRWPAGGLSGLPKVRLGQGASEARVKSVDSLCAVEAMEGGESSWPSDLVSFSQDLFDRWEAHRPQTGGVRGLEATVVESLWHEATIQAWTGACRDCV